MENAPRPRRLLRRPAVCELMGISPSTLDRMVRSGKFPPPVVITERTRGWFDDVVALKQEELRVTGAGGSTNDK
jgi:predicted DNA-binding transcriptional regulator AlpA